MGYNVRYQFDFSIMPPKKEQINDFREALERWAEETIPSKESLEKAVFGPSKLTIYHGVDPTAPHLHLGHSTNYLFLKKFQELGHKVVLLIGDFTARIGDPSGRTKERVPLTASAIEENLKTYKEQAGKILDFSSKSNPVKLPRNSKWLGKLKMEELIGVASNFTVQQMLARDMFQKRMREEGPIGLHEFLYPLMQGYDSVALKTDIEVGGSDQLFNMLAGRELVWRYLKKNKFVITTKLLINPKTGNKLMSKSEGEYIALDDPQNVMYGKVMALPDEVIMECFRLCTEVALEDVEKFKKLPPRDLKARLAREIVKMYHSESAAKEAEAEFQKVFVFDKAPSNTPFVQMVGGATSTAQVLIDAGMASSKSEATRLVEQGGVHIQAPGKEWERAGVAIDIKDNMVIRVGRRKFVLVKTRDKDLKNGL